MWFPKVFDRLITTRATTLSVQGDDAGLDRVAALLFNKQESR